jgi:TetR/AcrR family transcriptional regulator, ethionamide resistance regulator
MMPSITRKTASGRTRRDAVRGELLVGVERLLAAGESYTALGVQRICEEAGVSRSAFYANFANKSELLVAVVESATESIFEVTREWTDSDPYLGKAELAATMAHSVRVWREHYPLLAAYLEVSAYDHEIGSYWRKQFEEMIVSIQRRITVDQRAGLIANTLNPRTTAEFIVYAGERIAAEHVGREGQAAATDDALGRDMAEIIWTLLYGA